MIPRKFYHRNINERLLAHIMRQPAAKISPFVYTLPSCRFCPTRYMSLRGVAVPSSWAFSLRLSAFVNNTCFPGVCWRCFLYTTVHLLLFNRGPLFIDSLFYIPVSRLNLLLVGLSVKMNERANRVTVEGETSNVYYDVSFVETGYISLSSKQCGTNDYFFFFKN